MERNKAPISSEAQVASAGRTVYQIVKLLRMQRAQFDQMFEQDVFDRIVQPDLSSLAAYARGLRDAFLATILFEHCEFGYLLRDGSKVQLSQVAKVDPVSLIEASCGYSWKDSDWAFSEFRPVLDL